MLKDNVIITKKKNYNYKEKQNIMDSLLHYTTKNTIDIDFQQDIITNHNDYTHVIEHQLNNTDFKQAAQLVRILNTIKFFIILTLINITIMIASMIIKVSTTIIIVLGVSTLIFCSVIILSGFLLWKMNKKIKDDTHDDKTRLALISDPKLEKYFLIAQEKLAHNSSDSNWKMYVECFDRIKSLEEHYSDKPDSRTNIVNIVCEDLTRIK